MAASELARRYPAKAIAEHAAVDDDALRMANEGIRRLKAHGWVLDPEGEAVLCPEEVVGEHMVGLVGASDGRLRRLRRGWRGWGRLRFGHVHVRREGVAEHLQARLETK